MWDLHFSLSENYHIELTHLFEYVIKIYRWYQRTSTERCIQHTVSRSCSRKVVAGRLFLSSWILYHQWDNTTDKCSKQQKHHVLILFKPLRPLLMRWWDMRKPPPSLSYEGFDKKKKWLLFLKILCICRYVDPNDPTKIYLQQPSGESQLRRRAYHSSAAEHWWDIYTESTTWGWCDTHKQQHIKCCK